MESIGGGSADAFVTHVSVADAVLALFPAQISDQRPVDCKLA